MTIGMPKRGEADGTRGCQKLVTVTRSAQRHVNEGVLFRFGSGIAKVLQAFLAALLERVKRGSPALGTGPVWKDRAVLLLT